VAVIAAPVLFHSGYYITKTSDQFSRDFFGYDPFPESVDLAKYLSERTTIEDTIFILGSEAQLLVLSQRKSATSFALISGHSSYVATCGDGIITLSSPAQVSSRPPLKKKVT
jgi:hypothetical protein